jgi:hypothetical protein
MEEDNLILLKNIKRIEVSDALLENITHSIQLSNEDRIPYYKVSVAATIIVAAMIVQIFFIVNSSKSNLTSLNQVSEFTEINNNMLYYE